MGSFVEVTISDQVLSAVRNRMNESPDHVGFASVAADGSIRELPAELSEMIEAVLQALEVADTITVGVLAEELSSNAAADVLGISRPTLLKLARAGEIASSKVGTHTRFRRDAVLAFKDRREEERRRAMSELLQLEDQLDDHN